MKTFNFKTMRGSRERKLFYIDNYNKPITEEEFIKAVRSWKRKRRGNSNTRSVSIARYQYQMLKRVYGFFPDDNLNGEFKLALKGIESIAGVPTRNIKFSSKLVDKH